MSSRIPQPCLIERCTGAANVAGTARGFCSKHYTRLQRHGDPLWEPPGREERFWAKVDKNGPNGCWLWTGAKTGAGYGAFSTKAALAHRLSYEMLVGPIPAGLVLDHLCRVTACVNPGHLEPVTNRINVLRGTAPTAAFHWATHCIHGHEFTPDNTYLRPSGGRSCRACSRRSSRMLRSQLKGAA